MASTNLVIFGPRLVGFSDRATGWALNLFACSVDDGLGKSCDWEDIVKIPNGESFKIFRTKRSSVSCVTASTRWWSVSFIPFTPHSRPPYRISQPSSLDEISHRNPLKTRYRSSIACSAMGHSALDIMSRICR